MQAYRTKYDFWLKASASPDDVVAALAAHGIAVIPGFLDSAAVDRLKSECTALFEDDASWIHTEAYSLGQSRRMERAEIDTTAYPSLVDTFVNPFLEQIARAHLGEDCIFSRTIYVILDVVGSRTHVQELHYDKMRHLKAFVYLTDVGVDHGPFHCVPGSHRFAAVVQADKRARRIVPTDAEVRVLPDNLPPAIPVLGERGTLIMFDSDIVHCAGVPTGGPRLAARSLSFGGYRRDVWHREDGSIEQVV